MALDTTTTRPANVGGIDFSGIDIDAAVFKATGGGYGGGQTNPTAPDGPPRMTSDWVTNWGNGPVADEFDFSTPPGDPDAEIKLLAEPEVDNPLVDLLNPAGEDKPHFANGGPEGVSCAPVIGAVLIIGALILAAGEISGAFDDPKPDPQPNGGPSGEKDPKTGLNIWNNKFVDPDQMTGDLQSPAEMLTDLLKQNGIEGIDTSDIGVTDILANLSGKMDQLGEIMNTLRGAAEKGDADAFAGALDQLMSLAGLEGGAFNPADLPPQDMLANIFESFGIANGIEGGYWLQGAQEQETVSVLLMDDLPDWVASWFVDIA